MAPINTGLFYNGHLTDNYYDFHSKRSGNNIGIVYVGNVAIDKKMLTNSNTAYFTKDNLSEWTRLTDTISKKGSVPAIQLGCRISRIPAMRELVNNKPNEYIEKARDEINKLSVSEIDHVVDQFIDAAKKAYACGFKILQIHAAHGYFLSLLCNPIFNFRKDKYNVTDALCIKNIIYCLAKELPDVLLDVRISFLSGINPCTAEIEAGFKLLNLLSALPLDIISISNGIYNIDKRYIYPLNDNSEKIILKFGNQLAKQFPDKLFNLAGNLSNVKKLLEYESDNLLFSFGRQLLCDPEFITKSLNNQESLIRRCSYCGQCHYYSNNNDFLQYSCII